MNTIKSQTLQLSEKHRVMILTLLAQFLPDTEVWVYGSRTKGTANSWSDLDMVVFTDANQRGQVEQLREAFEKSDLPIRVDLSVWRETPQSFKKTIMKHKVILQDKKEKNVSE